MPGKLLLSTAYLPPAEYFSRIARSGGALIEREENYIKQTYRNRCCILASSGPQVLTVPVCLGSFHKTPIRDIRIDYSKRWQQVHLGSLMSAYGSSPYYLYYHEAIESVIMHGHEYLLDLNMELLVVLLKMIKLEAEISYTEGFLPAGEGPEDFRYRINPREPGSYRPRPYRKVFDCKEADEMRYSIVDLVFNLGPDSLKFL